MSRLQWRDEFKVGITEVDHEHRELIGLINELHEAIQQSVDPDQILESLGEIYAQISAHFALEEKMMRKIRYPAYKAHKDDHETLLDDLRDIMDDVEDDGVLNETQLMSDLNRWFSDHFRTHDAKLHQSGHG
ncbi:MAG: hemerythrin family protein [Gammaproteobacteria bacterium]|nr:hemerythrin family protein [Gammaproteobacteria bacterium]MDH3372192.1 hemerythrin family protein [Gammaproteobacteria bacterium]MDH3409611.1 hemerythrin family protein [Gammaproteobacteria bacterium]MDH3551864.1 hemerythrin family protein [Gammaproteobacteria bacterium]